MLTYFTILVAIVLFMSFLILDKLKEVRKKQDLQEELIQDILLRFGNTSSGLTPEMLAAYLDTMTESQNQRYNQWLRGKDHEPFTFQEIQELEKKLNG
ncbi:MAG: hypothetical protein ABI687_04570 [Flavitalea sp.]